MNNDVRQQALKIADLILDKKGEDVIVMDMSTIGGLCDAFVVCSATSSTRAKTIAEHVATTVKKDGHELIHRDGVKEGKWIVLDFADIVVHVFESSVRKFYSLEQLWGDAPRIPTPQLKG